MDDSVPLSEATLLNILANFDLSFVIQIVAVLLLLVLSALISGSEAAFFSLTPEEKEEINDDKNMKFASAVKLLRTPKELLATILIGNNFVNVAIVILSSMIFERIYPPNIAFEGVDYLRAIIEVGGITFVILLVGEVIPKVYATRNGLKLISITAGPLEILSRIPPISWLKSFLVNGTEVILKYARKREIDISTDDLETAIALTRDDGSDSEEQKILEGIVNFGNTDVRQIMRPRMDVVAISDELNYEELIATILDAGYSRMPVYKENFDNVTGILFVKDLLEHLDAPVDFKWQEVQRPAFFVPENKKIDDLLKDFQEKKMHMAVVVDEYGGSSGVVTLEDVLEEIVGEITDEFDDEDIVYTKIDDSTYLFEGKTSLVDMYKVLDIDGKAFEEEKGESDSIGGFLIEQAGRILRNNEYINFESFKFVVESSDKKRVKLVKVIKLT